MKIFRYTGWLYNIVGIDIAYYYGLYLSNLIHIRIRSDTQYSNQWLRLIKLLRFSTPDSVPASHAANGSVRCHSRGLNIRESHPQREYGH